MLENPQVANGRTRIHTQALMSPSSGCVLEGGRDIQGMVKWAGVLPRARAAEQ